MEYFYIKCCDNVRFYYTKPLTINDYDKYMNLTMSFYSGKIIPSCICYVNDKIQNIKIEDFNFNLIKNVDVKEHNKLCKEFNFKKIF